MSDKILELSERLTNQIAAGEVVERPASVVKELIENAIDANSTQINILLEEAGLKKIQVIDNGTGISPEDAESAFKRHATSKIHSRDDLFRIRTLGFRGEALPSIASVSEITFETATENASQGTYLYLKGGKIEENQPSVLRQGTKIIVENLFYNTPARLKYVKTLQTELAHIGDIVNRLALSHPNVAFYLVHEGNQMLSTSGNGDLKQTMAGIYGVQTAKKMREIQAEDLDFKIHGYVTLPEVTRATRNYLSTIVNGRYIKNFALNKAIVNGYGSKLMVGRFPIAVIEIEMDPLLVDVNVHPTKQEVRLSKEQELTTLLSKTINERLREENLIPNAAENLDFNKKVSEQEKAQQLSMDFEESTKNEKKGLAYDKQTGDFYVNETVNKPVENFVDKVGDESGKVEDFYENTSEEADVSAFSSQENELDSENSSVETVEKEQAYPKKNAQESITDHPEFDVHQKENRRLMEKVMTEKPTEERFPQLDYFGQMHGTYLFAQNTEGLYIIDQHAAQERIKYEYFRRQIGEVSTDLQELLVPIVLDYPNDDALRLKEQADLLEDVGIYLEEFGANSFIVRSHPTWYPRGQEEETIREMIDMLLTTGEVSVKKFREKSAIMMSCKRSIKANHHLNDAQARVLLTDLAACENPFNCPHGRPVLIHFDNYDMERMFKRIQDPH
ncbi:DNA mismatch repair protein MutL [Tetragenococcus halophilus]|uniref:DNA mismatch repair endonuclease MutL n=1 Tax=Tetragenococcus halophilus TaxID=51669 RepID=UPI001927237D|nr:DNA mismatch repair endonuclease MutL [Tetragenococcus halophilus]MCF1676781.1 DNA mismatch repair endonuclease MutL [Tetragenococcus halophilus]GEQ37498.1 DNA mismatch repair protein MutL [Tetragenococcus halophilus]GEQ39746.1 DNA mismatch repair protein MutL [Tetragenococcus halophilus]GEQ42185.1 DNA mismatch repair protein MutL [Tetragenococcus halophilus]GEQ44133.1 DNA mismatch repair protein MutL [Tetragenococcus halophilus]